MRKGCDQEFPRVCQVATCSRNWLVELQSTLHYLIQVYKSLKNRFPYANSLYSIPMYLFSQKNRSCCQETEFGLTCVGWRRYTVSKIISFFWIIGNSLTDVLATIDPALISSSVVSKSLLVSTNPLLWYVTSPSLHHASAHWPLAIWLDGTRINGIFEGGNTGEDDEVEETTELVAPSTFQSISWIRPAQYSSIRISLQLGDISVQYTTATLVHDVDTFHFSKKSNSASPLLLLLKRPFVLLRSHYPIMTSAYHLFSIFHK